MKTLQLGPTDRTLILEALSRYAEQIGARLKYSHVDAEDKLKLEQTRSHAIVLQASIKACTGMALTKK